MNLTELKQKPITELLELAEQMGIENMARSRKQDVIFSLLKKHAKSGEEISGDGVLEILQDGFRITRIIHYGNSFLPIVTGKFLNGPSGVLLRISMSLHPLVILFLCVWFGFVGIIGLIVLLAVVTGQDSGFQLSLILLAMFVLGWGFTCGIFWLEATKQRKMLMEMFSQRLDGGTAPLGS
jgi:hypothetical protein